MTTSLNIRLKVVTVRRLFPLVVWAILILKNKIVIMILLLMFKITAKDSKLTHVIVDKYFVLHCAESMLNGAFAKNLASPSAFELISS